MRPLPVFATFVTISVLGPANASAAAALPAPAPSSAQSLQWTKLHPKTWPTGAHQAGQMVYDPSRRQLVLYSTPFDRSVATYVWTGVNWRNLEISSPPFRWLTVMAYDEARGNIVLFGGDMSEGSPLDETWVFQDDAWTQLDTPTAPTPRYGAAMAYDPIREEVILFGGYDGSGFLDDTWAFDGTTWARLYPGANPTPRYGAQMTYDPRREQLLLYGGDAPIEGPGYRLTWAWDGAHWRPVRLRDGLGRRITFFGMATVDGLPTVVARDKMWVLRRHGWQLVMDHTPPRAAQSFAFAWDPRRNEAILLGGYDRRGWSQTATWSLARN